MVLPLLPLIAVAGAGAIAGVGTSSLLGGGQGASNPSAITNEAMFRNYTYSPTETLTDSRQFIDSRQLLYSPSVQIDSPNATITKKEALQNTPTQTLTPTITASPITSPSFSEERGTATSSGLNPLLILGVAVIGAGAYYFANKK